MEIYRATDLKEPPSELQQGEKIRTAPPVILGAARSGSHRPLLVGAGRFD